MHDDDTEYQFHTFASHPTPKKTTTKKTKKTNNKQTKKPTQNKLIHN